MVLDSNFLIVIITSLIGVVVWFLKRTIDDHDQAVKKIGDRVDKLHTEINEMRISMAEVETRLEANNKLLDELFKDTARFDQKFDSLVDPKEK